MPFTLKPMALAAAAVNPSARVNGSCARLTTPHRRSLAPLVRRRSVHVQAVAVPPEKSQLGSNGHPSGPELAAKRLGEDVDSLAISIAYHMKFHFGRSDAMAFNGGDKELAYRALARSVAEHLVERLNVSYELQRQTNPKFAYYLSMEFLMGRTLLNAVENLELAEPYKEALRTFGYDLEELEEQETDAALGNGGLGRLAACFLDSMATLDLPCYGYGLRYTYGMFKQVIEDGEQHESPDYWLCNGNPWEVERLDVSYPIRFYGEVSCRAVAYDNPVPGWGTKNTIPLRLWAARPDVQFDIKEFGEGNHFDAIRSKHIAENINYVLYPDDSTAQGKQLRLKQQYFFTSASLQDIVHRFLEAGNSWEDFPDKVAVQLNDTHPTIGVAELMRIFIDDYNLEWDQAWELTTGTFAYTNHTVLPEALEKWPLAAMDELLPRCVEIIKRINKEFIANLESRGADEETIARMTPIALDEWGPGEHVVRMASLAMCGSHTVNGVAAVHSELIKITVLKDFYDFFPEKFQNKTNGVTQRRWLAFCNPKLRDLITEALGSEQWIGDLPQLSGLAAKADDPEFQAKWRAVKTANKEKLATLIKETTGYSVPTSAIFDVQVKRIHEYKRQLLNILHTIHRYHAIKEMTPEEKKNVVPRMVLIGGKAAAAYKYAKEVIHLINNVAAVINNDPEIGDLLKVIFHPNYNVSGAEVIIPATEVTQQISTAGTEASGTSNMKFAMNGALLCGTMDGANIEIWEEIGEENGFIFGARVEEVDGMREERNTFVPCPEFTAALKCVEDGEFGPKKNFEMILNSLIGEDGDHYLPRDYYLLARDFEPYMKAQAEVEAVYKDQVKWTKMSILSTAGMGKFSTDRTIAQYAEEIWKINPLPHQID